MNTCAKDISKIGWRNKLCGKTAKHEHEGRWYCGMHYPPRAEERQKKRRADKLRAYEYQLERRRKVAAIAAAEHRVAEAALKLEFFRNELEGWPVVGPDALPEFESALDELRRLKGEG